MIGKWRPGFRIFVVLAVLAIAGLFLVNQEARRVLNFTHMTLTNPRKVLTVDSGPVQADAAVVLGGAAAERATRAAELYHDGSVRMVVVSGTGDTDTNMLALLRAGVPRRAILAEPDSRSTFQNAGFSIKLLREHGAHRIVIVTSWYHSRRALACFQKLAPDLTFYSRPSYWGYKGDAENQRLVDSYARRECLKLLFYRVRYGIPLGG